MKKILILGNSNSIWVKKYIEKVLLNNDYAVYVASNDDGRAFKEFYTENDVNIIDLTDAPKSSFINRIPKIRGLYNFYSSKKLLKSFGHFDIVHIHFVSAFALMLAVSLKKKNTRIVASYWGSDLFRKTDKQLKKQKKHLEKMDVITLSTKEMLLKFQSVFGDCYDKKICSVLFGVSGFEHISKIKKEYSVSECKKMMGIDESLITVAIGYNSSLLQQHDKVLSLISALPCEIQKKMQIVLQLGYGHREELYFNKLNSIIEKMECKVITCEKFLSDEEVAILRNSVDVYINSQKTDAFSASVQEYLYAKKIVINPTWIKYHELQENDIYDIKYADFNELRNMLIQIITEFDLYKEKFSDNERIYNLSSWEASKAKWLNCYSNSF